MSGWFFFWGLLFLCAEALGRRNRSSRARWTGSRLNTTEYNYELELIELAKVDYLRPAMDGKKKELLCASFVYGSLSASRSLFGNVDNSEVDCDWAVVVYDGDESLICNPLKLKSSVVHCRLIPEESFQGLGMFGLSTTATPLVKDKNTGRVRRPTIPKTILYTELVPLLKDYKRVMLLDEDISLDGFGTKRFLQIWNCAFYPHVPLVVQPLIAENTQFLQYMNARAWKSKKGVLASASGLVEQQVPAFDSAFFHWFLTRVLPITRPVVLANGVDWGHDRTWCNAAQMYAANVLQWASKEQGLGVLPACAIITGAAPVHHLNTRSMTSKRTQRERYRLGGRAVVQEYINRFPTWVLLDISRGPDPTAQSSGHRFIKVTSLAENCAGV